jgi:uncharacterized protein (TIGR00290 family)
MKRILLSWSSGKDSAWALHLLRSHAEYRAEYEVGGLLTTFNQAFDRVAMHAVRRSLVEQQAAAARLPLWTVPLPWPCPNEEYERLMAGTCVRALAEGIEGVAFGDLFLEDVRAYRIKQLQGTGLEPVFPVWGLPTLELAREMIAAGLRARLTCVDPRKLDRSFAGRDFDETLLADFPEGIDPCGERGEFHSFVYAGPMFSSAIPVTVGEIVTRDQFVFADLISAGVMGTLKTILASDEPRQVKAGRVADAIRVSGPYRWVGLYDVDHISGVVSNIAWSGPGAPAYPTFPVTQGLTSRVIAGRQTVNVSNVASDPDYLTALGTTQSEIIVPAIGSSGHVVGTIDVESEKRDAFDRDTWRLLEEYAQALRPLWAQI